MEPAEAVVRARAHTKAELIGFVALRRKTRAADRALPALSEESVEIVATPDEAGRVDLGGEVAIWRRAHGALRNALLERLVEGELPPHLQLQ